MRGKCNITIGVLPSSVTLLKISLHIPSLEASFHLRFYTTAVRMSLCKVCQDIPFRPILMYEFEYEKDWHNVRSHHSISQLVSSGKFCPLCKVLANALETSSRNMVVDEKDDRPV